jgi:hypothetical protein
LLGLLLGLLALLGLLRLLAWLSLSGPLGSTRAAVRIVAAVIGLVGEGSGRCQSAQQQDQTQPSS